MLSGETSQSCNHGLKCALDGVTALSRRDGENSTNPGGCFECCQCAFLGGMMVNHGSGIIPTDDYTHFFLHLRRHGSGMVNK